MGAGGGRYGGLLRRTQEPVLNEAIGSRSTDRYSHYLNRKARPLPSEIYLPAPEPGTCGFSLVEVDGNLTIHMTEEADCRLVSPNGEGVITVRSYQGDDGLSLHGRFSIEYAVFLGAGDDTVKGSGESIIRGGFGHDFIDFGRGADRLFGGKGRDELFGRAGKDFLHGGSARDVLKGGGGKDTLKGGTGGDKLLGQTGDDILRGGAGRDTLKGGIGDDYLHGQSGNDKLTGNAGRDIFMFNRGDGSDTITDFELGVDHIQISRGASRLAQLDFDQVGEDVLVSFRNVEIKIENTTVDDLAVSDHFLFV